VYGQPFLALLWSFIHIDGLTPQSTSVISSDVVQVFLMVSPDTFCIDQLSDQFEARIIPDNLGPDFRQQLQHHPPLLTGIKIHYRRFNRLEIHTPRSLLPESAHQSPTELAWILLFQYIRMYKEKN
jgi:hypothetical protein